MKAGINKNQDKEKSSHIFINFNIIVLSIPGVRRRFYPSRRGAIIFKMALHKGVKSSLIPGVKIYIWEKFIMICLFVCLVFNTTFNNISVLLVEETHGPGENPRRVASH
jgi:hypothetical protein